VTAPHPQGVLVVDDSGDRKDGHATAHVGRQWLERLGKTDNGVVTVTTVWANECVYYPLHAQPYTPAAYFPGGKNDPAFHTKPQLAAALVGKAIAAGFPCAAVVADCAYGDNDTFRHAVGQTAGLPHVLALKPNAGCGVGPTGHTHRGRRPPAGLGRTTPAWGVAEDPAPVPGRAYPDLVGRGCGVGRVGSVAAGTAGRGRALLRTAHVGGAKLQTGQRRTGLGRFPSPLRHRDPPASGPGAMRVLVVLEHGPGWQCGVDNGAGAGGHRQLQREGDPAAAHRFRCRTGRRYCAWCEAD